MLEDRDLLQRLVGSRGGQGRSELGLKNVNLAALWMRSKEPIADAQIRELAQMVAKDSMGKGTVEKKTSVPW